LAAGFAGDAAGGAGESAKTTVEATENAARAIIETRFI
jgi:hypothetical protein